MEHNARVAYLEKELAAKQERIDMLENIHKSSVEQLVRERVGRIRSIWLPFESMK
jgi:hypothetical protein